MKLIYAYTLDMVEENLIKQVSKTKIPRSDVRNICPTIW